MTNEELKSCAASRERLYRGKRVDNGEWVEGIGILDFAQKGHVYIAKPNKPKTAIVWIEVIGNIHDNPELLEVSE